MTFESKKEKKKVSIHLEFYSSSSVKGQLVESKEEFNLSDWCGKEI